MTLLAQRHLMLRYAIGLAPMIALVAPIDRAEAACDPASPVSNVTVTCTGTTINQDGNTGYGSGDDPSPSDSGNTYNIVSGASLTGTRIGLLFDKALIINNFGTITGGSVDGVRGTVGVVNNFGAISGARSGVDIFGTGVVNNSGSISGGRIGVELQNGEVTNTSTGTITGGTMGLRFSMWPKFPMPGLSREESVASILAGPLEGSAKSQTAAALRAGPTQ